MKNPLHRLSLHTLKFFLRFMRRTHELFTGAGVAFVSAVLVIGLFMLVWWGIGAVKNAFELQLERALVERLLTLVVPRESVREGPLDTPALRQFIRSSATDLSLISASFSDLFSGTGWLDEASTTMYHDRSATAFFFAPAFELHAAAASEWSNAREERYCVRERCVVRSGNALALDGASVSIPDASGNLISVSVGALDTVWVVGAVYEVGEEYRGEVWYFDGTRFTRVFDNGTLFVSRYPGAFGFDGSDDDWVAIYGAYEGMGYQFRYREAPRSLSHLLGVRSMGGGFRPRVARMIAADAWYLWNAEGNGIRFLKLFEDGKGNIVGLADLSGALFSSVGSDANRVDAEVRSGRILMKFEGNGVVTYREFVDRGFRSGNYAVVSGNLNLRNAEVRQARISGASLESTGVEVRFSLANQEGEWMPAPAGEWVAFPAAQGKNLFWKAEFLGANDLTLHSPFFDMVQLEYFIRFLAEPEAQ